MMIAAAPKNSRVVSRGGDQIASLDKPGEEFAAILDVLLEIRDELRRLNDSLQPRRVDICAPNDERMLSALLPAVAGRYGSSPFTVSELIRDPIFKALLGDLNPKRVGKLLSRNTERDIAGLCVSRLIEEHGRAVWQVLKAPKHPTR